MINKIIIGASLLLSVSLQASDVAAKTFMKNFPINASIFLMHKQGKHTLKNRTLFTIGSTQIKSDFVEELTNANIVAGLQAYRLKQKTNPVHVLGIENMAFAAGLVFRHYVDKGISYCFPTMAKDGWVRSLVSCAADCIARSIVRSALYNSDQKRQGAAYGVCGVITVF